MVKDVSLVLFEAVVVGVGLILIYEIVKRVVTQIGMKEPSNLVILFVSGAVFHLVCEYTGVNQWYSEKYCKLLRA